MFHCAETKRRTAAQVEPLPRAQVPSPQHWYTNVGEDWLEDDLRPGKRKRAPRVFSEGSTVRGSQVPGAGGAGRKRPRQEAGRSDQVEVVSDGSSSEAPPSPELNGQAEQEAELDRTIVPVSSDEEQDRDISEAACSELRPSHSGAATNSRKGARLKQLRLTGFGTQRIPSSRRLSADSDESSSSSPVLQTADPLPQAPAVTMATGVPPKVKVKVSGQLLVVPLTRQENEGTRTIGWLAKQVAQR